MAKFVVILAPEAAHQRLLQPIMTDWGKKGYVVTDRLESPTWNDVLSALQHISLFSPQQMIVVETMDSLGKFVADLAPYWNQDHRQLVIFLTTKKPKVTDFPKNFYQQCEIITEPEVPYWPRQRAGWLQQVARSMGAKLSSDGAAKLVDWISDPEELRAKIELLARLYGSMVIGDAEVEQLAEDEGSRDMLKVLEAVEQRSILSLRAPLSSLRKKNELFPVLAGVTNRVRAAYYVSLLGKKAVDLLDLTDYQGRLAMATSRLYGREKLGLALGDLLRLSLQERRGEGEGWEGLFCVLDGMMTQ